MPSRRFDWLQRVKGVEREYNATRYATDYVLNVVRRDPNALRGDVRTRDIDEAAERLEGTYIIRIFAEFETCLRKWWEAVRGSPPPFRTRDLLDGVGAWCRVPSDWINNAHAVRDLRNSLVHEREGDVEPIAIGTTRSHLCRFLSSLRF